MEPVTMPEVEVRDRLASLMGPDWDEKRAAWSGWDLRSARLTMHLSQSEAAQIIGCHPNCISSWENGKATPHPKHFRAVLAFLAIADEALNA